MILEVWKTNRRTAPNKEVQYISLGFRLGGVIWVFYRSFCTGSSETRPAILLRHPSQVRIDSQRRTNLIHPYSCIFIHIHPDSFSTANHKCHQCTRVHWRLIWKCVWADQTPRWSSTERLKNGDEPSCFSAASWGTCFEGPISYLGVSENSVPLNPMVNDHYPY